MLLENTGVEMTKPLIFVLVDNHNIDVKVHALLIWIEIFLRYNSAHGQHVWIHAVFALVEIVSLFVAFFEPKCLWVGASLGVQIIPGLCVVWWQLVLLCRCFTFGDSQATIDWAFSGLESVLVVVQMRLRLRLFYTLIISINLLQFNKFLAAIRNAYLLAISVCIHIALVRKVLTLSLSLEFRRFLLDNHGWYFFLLSVDIVCQPRKG